MQPYPVSSVSDVNPNVWPVFSQLAVNEALGLGSHVVAPLQVPERSCFTSIAVQQNKFVPYLCITAFSFCTGNEAGAPVKARTGQWSEGNLSAHSAAILL